MMAPEAVEGGREGREIAVFVCPNTNGRVDERSGGRNVYVFCTLAHQLARCAADRPTTVLSGAFVSSRGLFVQTERGEIVAAMAALPPTPSFPPRSVSLFPHLLVRISHFPLTCSVPYRTVPHRTDRLIVLLMCF